MQNQPRTPCPNPIMSGYLLSQSEALTEASTNKNALTDLSYHLSSIGDTKKVDAKKSSDCGKDMAKAAGLKSWNTKTVHAIVVCYHCGKR